MQGFAAGAFTGTRITLASTAKAERASTVFITSLRVENNWIAMTCLAASLRQDPMKRQWQGEECSVMACVQARTCRARNSPPSPSRLRH
jgi:hypothetical protein